MSQIKSPLRYPGGKSRMVKIIEQHIPEFNEYREPFFGGGSVGIDLLQSKKYSGAKFLANDINQKLYYFWKAAKNHNELLVNKIIAFKKKYKNGELLYKFIVENKDENFIDIAAMFFILNRITFSGTTESGVYSPAAFAGRFTDSSIERVKAISPILQHISFSCYDYSRNILVPGEKVFIYIDPPYLSAEKSKLYGKRGNLHSGFNHSELRDLLIKTKHKWLITYDDSIEIRDLYNGFNITEVDFTYSMTNVKKPVSKTGKEIIIKNY